MLDKKKVIILGGSDNTGLAAAIKNLDHLFDVEMVAPEDINKLNTYVPDKNAFKLNPAPIIKTFFNPPISRRDRRAQNRKNKK
jgi:hypothetical protein